MNRGLEIALLVPCGKIGIAHFMSIFVGLHHTTRYEYDRPVWLGPQAVRLRPAPHCRAPISNYALTVEPAQRSVHWQQDPYANWLARFIFREQAAALSL